MAYATEQPLSALRRIDFPPLAGFVMSLIGVAAIVFEVNVRGWWGFATSGMELVAVMIWLSLAGLLSMWAFDRSEGYWQALAFLGVVLSVVAAAMLVVLAVLRFLFEHPDILMDSSKQKRRGRRSRRSRTRRRGRRRW